MTRQKTNHIPTDNIQPDEGQALNAGNRHSASPIDLETLTPQNRARLNTAVMALVDYLVSVSPRS
jgi:hypothetical protein